MRILALSFQLLALSWRLIAGSWKLFVAPLRRLHILEGELLFVKRRLLADALEFPGRDVREIVVVTHRFAVRGLALFTEVTAGRFGAVQGVEREDFSELEVVGNAAGVLEVLVHIVLRAR